MIYRFPQVPVRGASRARSPEVKFKNQHTTDADNRFQLQLLTMIRRFTSSHLCPPPVESPHLIWGKGGGGLGFETLIMFLNLRRIPQSVYYVEICSI